MITDRVYLVDGVRATKLQAAVTKSPVYFYLFGYRGKHSFTEVNSGTTNNYGKIVATRVLTKCSWVSIASYSWTVLTNIHTTRKQLCILLSFPYLKIWTAISGLQPPKQRCRIDFWYYCTLNDRMIMRETVTREDVEGLQTMGRWGPLFFTFPNCYL
jgi:hypothetical protein